MTNIIGNLPPGHDALIFSISDTGLFILYPVSQTRLDIPKPLIIQSGATGESQGGQFIGARMINFSSVIMLLRGKGHYIDTKPMSCKDPIRTCFLPCTDTLSTQSSKFRRGFLFMNTEEPVDLMTHDGSVFRNIYLGWFICQTKVSNLFAVNLCTHRISRPVATSTQDKITIYLKPLAEQNISLNDTALVLTAWFRFLKDVFEKDISNPLADMNIFLLDTSLSLTVCLISPRDVFQKDIFEDYLCWRPR